MPIDNITIISLILSVAGVGGAITGFALSRRSISKIASLNSRMDVYALVKEFSERIGSMEQRLVDQKVRLEVMELRSKRVSISTGIVSELGTRRILGEREGATTSKSSVTSNTSAVQEEANGRKTNNLKRRDSGSLEKEILHLVAERNGKVVAREIQSQIGRSREHTARLMNILFKRGLVLRDGSARPFTYSITEKGRMALES